jgi:AcrR family transcriptional regulator
MTEADKDQCDLLDGLRRGRPAAGQDPVKRSQIIEGARRVFIDKGFEAASMNDITREAGVSKGTIYVYFANKEELFEALIEEERGTIFKNMYDVLERTDNLRETLVRFGMVLSAKITSAKVILAQRTVIGASERIPELGARFYERGPKRGCRFSQGGHRTRPAEDRRRRPCRLSVHRTMPGRSLPPVHIRLSHQGAKPR